MPTRKSAAPKSKTTTPLKTQPPARTSAKSGKASSARKAAGGNGPSRLRDLIAGSLDADKAEDIVSYDLVGRTSLTDYMIIASGKSARQVAAMAEHLREKLESLGRKPSIEGLPNGDWVLVDTGDVVVHLFRPEVRAFYQLEQIWAPEALTAVPR